MSVRFFSLFIYLFILDICHPISHFFCTIDVGCLCFQVTPNLYGNLVANTAAGIAGGTGVMPGGNCLERPNNT